ncbi:hypothetical protein RDV77_09155 [Porphyromonadaceae sp. NP-X]|nr:hypothetical protein [Porphyromonadaceae sp. NP-X]
MSWQIKTTAKRPINNRKVPGVIMNCIKKNWLNPLMLKARIARKTGNIESNKCPVTTDKRPVLPLNCR